MPNSRRRSSRPLGEAQQQRAVRSRIEARLRRSWSRPALMRWQEQRRASPSVEQQQLAAPADAVNVAPSSACSGGSKVFSALMPGARADSTVSPARAGPSRRAVISISGSSGTLGTVELPSRTWTRGCSRRAAEIARPRRARARGAGRGLLAVGRRARRRGVRLGVRRAAARRGRGRARAVLLPRPRAGPAGAAPGHRRRRDRCCSATSTRSSRHAAPQAARAATATGWSARAPST